MDITVTMTNLLIVLGISSNTSASSTYPLKPHASMNLKKSNHTHFDHSYHNKHAKNPKAANFNPINFYSNYNNKQDCPIAT